MNVFLVASVVFGSNIQAEVAHAASNAIALNTSNVSDNIIDVKTSGRSFTERGWKRARLRKKRHREMKKIRKLLENLSGDVFDKADAELIHLMKDSDTKCSLERCKKIQAELIALKRDLLEYDELKVLYATRSGVLNRKTKGFIELLEKNQAAENEAMKHFKEAFRLMGARATAHAGGIQQILADDFAAKEAKADAEAKAAAEAKVEAAKDAEEVKAIKEEVPTTPATAVPSVPTTPDRYPEPVSPAPAVSPVPRDDDSGSSDGDSDSVSDSGSSDVSDSVGTEEALPGALAPVPEPDSAGTDATNDASSTNVGTDATNDVSSTNAGTDATNDASSVHTMQTTQRTANQVTTYTTKTDHQTRSSKSTHNLDLKKDTQTTESANGAGDEHEHNDIVVVFSKQKGKPQSNAPVVDPQTVPVADDQAAEASAEALQAQNLT